MRKIPENLHFFLAPFGMPRYIDEVLYGPGESFPRNVDLRYRGEWEPHCAARSSRKEQLEMAESKVQKVARQTAARKSVGNCQCGGELIWAQVIMTRPRMMKVCEKCGSFHEKE